MKEQRPIRRLDGPTRRVVRKPSAKPATTPTPPSDEVVKDDIAATEPAAVETEAAAPEVEVSPKSESNPEAAPLKRRWRDRLKGSKKVVALTLTLLIVAGLITFGVHAVMASRHIVTKNSTGGAPALTGEIDPTKLKGEGDGRINVLLLGTGGNNHDGGNLSDTMMVASIDPVNKTVAMLSIPRDLYVKIPGYGYNKINAANSFGGPELAKQVVSGVLDLPIHYYVQVDFSGFKQAVDAVGGVDIANATKLYDPEYPCDNEKGYCTFSLPVGQYHMDGNLALKFARCRHGQCGNDFGRAARQQQLMAALRQKSLQASTLTNPVKMSGLIDSVGDHVRTDFQPKEMQKMATIVKDIDMTKAVNKVLDNSDTGLLVDGSGKYAGAGSILLPKAGDFNYGDIQELAHSIFTDGYLQKEAAAVQIQNGTTQSGLAAAVSKQLTAYGYHITDAITAPEQTHTTSQIIDYSDGKKPFTVKYLEARFHTKAVKQTRPVDTAGQPTGPDVVIIVGSDYRTTTGITTTTKP